MNLWSDDNSSMMEAFMASADLSGYPSWAAPSPLPATPAPAAPALSPAPASYFNQETLQQRLQTLIETAKEIWTYAIFWQSSVDVATGDSLLGWGDGYYKGGSEEDKRKGKSSASSAADQEHRKRVLRELNSLISGGPPPDEAVEEDVTDTEWFFLVSMTQSFVNGDGLPGQALFSGQPSWLAGGGMLAVAPCERARQGQQFGIQTIVCFPVGNGGVLELGSTGLIFHSTEIMNRVRVLFSFNGLEVAGGGGGSWIPPPQFSSAAAAVNHGETDPSAMWISDPSVVEIKDLVSPAEIAASKQSVQFENPSSSSLTENPSSMHLQQQFHHEQQQNGVSNQPAQPLFGNNKDDNNKDDNNLLSQFINDEVHETTSEDKGSKSSVMRQSSNEMSSIILFSNYDIERATNGLSDSLKIGQGGYGTVYKGKLHDSEVAIKILDSSSDQGIAEFHQEMEVLGRMRHQNLVKLIGACIQLRALVYEFLPHGSVEDYLKKDPGLLTWQIRTRIVYEICSALTFLHSRQPQLVVHGDLKPANILLDVKFISKLADFGLCRFLPGETATVAFLETHNIKGTEWYIDPDFLETGKLTRGCDVYSFGITMLRILTGAPAPRVYRKVERAIREKSLIATVDSTAGKWPENVVEYLARMGLECCEPDRKSSKLMEDILTGLEEILAKIDT